MKGAFAAVCGLFLSSAPLMRAAETNASAGAPAVSVSFRREIAPVLVAKCMACHSAQKAKGGFRLHSFEALFHPGKSKSVAIVPGKPEESELFKRISTSDEDDRMPQKDEPLPKATIELIRRWIAQGASYDAADAKALLSSIIPHPPSPPPPEDYLRPVPILSLAFTPDGNRLAASGHNEVTVWSLSGELQQRITNVSQRVHQIAFHPSEPFLAVAGGKPGRAGELALYRSDTGRFETNLVEAGDELLTVAFSPDGQRLAAGGADNTIHVFDWKTRHKISAIQQHADWVTCVRFNSDGSKLASASRDRTARIYDALSGNLETTYAGHAEFVFAISFLSDGRVASAGRDQTIQIWDAAEGKKKAEMGGFEGDIYQLLSTEAGLFAAGADKIVRQYSVADRHLIRAFSGQSDAVYSMAYAPSANLLASGGYDGRITLWKVKTGELEKSFIAAPGFQTAR